jgi:hypothetical protein
MSTLAERSASATYEQFYGEVPIDQVITEKSIRVLAKSPQTERGILFDQVDSFQNARTELTAASLLQERFGVPLCLAAVQPFLILLSKEQEAIDWERMTSMQLMDQLQSMIQIALTRLAEIETLRQQKEQELAALHVAEKDLQTDPLHETVSSLANQTKQRIENKIEIVVRFLSNLARESSMLERTSMELFATRQNVTSELSTPRSITTEFLTHVQ